MDPSLAIVWLLATTCAALPSNGTAGIAQADSAGAFILPAGYASGGLATDLSRLPEAGSAAESTPAPACQPWVPVEDCGPLWTARLGAVFLQRGRPQDTPLLVNGFTGDTLVSASDFVFPYQAGVDAGLIRHADWADVEFRYFGINDASASQGPFNFGPGVAIAVPPYDPSPFPVAVQMQYLSSVNSIETNLRRNVSPRWALLAGFRYVSLRDRMHLNAAEQNDPIRIGFGTTNNLFGAQIGADGILWDSGNRFRVESAIKAGIYANGAKFRLSFQDTEESNSFVFGSDQTSFVGDLSFTGVYQINKCWALRAGYQLLWLSGVAVASEQLNELDFNNNQMGVNDTHSAFFHGATVGVERCW